MITKRNPSKAFSLLKFIEGFLEIVNINGVKTIMPTVLLTHQEIPNAATDSTDITLVINNALVVNTAPIIPTASAMNRK